tara:strand:- start:11 stop:376 length:366 start_codon:yes stop_codon:yes gene_type:complete
MGQSYPIGDFTVTKSNPSGNIVRFTITDASNQLTTSKMQRAVQADALAQFITAESADLITNGDAALETQNNKGLHDATRSHDSPEIEFVYGSKYMDVTLTALTNIAATGAITASIAYGDVA